MSTLKLVEPAQMAFNYDLVAAPVAIQAREAAERIKLRLRRSAEDIIDIGRDLIEQKASLGHGNFLPWIEAEFGMSDETARKMMRVAEVYGPKFQLGWDLPPPTVLYELAAPKTPAEVRAEIEKMIEAGEVVTKATVVELRSKLSGLEKAKALAEEEIELKDAKVSELQETVNLAISEGIEKASKRIAKGFEDEIARLKREVSDLRKPKPAPVIDNDTGEAVDVEDNIVPMHRPLTDGEKSAIDAEHDEYQDADFIETASDKDRAISAFGSVRNIAKVSASPKAVYQYVASHSKATVDEYMAMVDQALSLLKSVKELHND